MSRIKGCPGLEFEAPDQWRLVQSDGLAKHLALCARRSPYYRRLFKEAGVKPAKIGLDTLSELPLTCKTDLALHNDEFLAVPDTKIVDIVLSSGTTGKPTRIMYTEKDLQRLAYNEEISFGSCGVTARDVVLLTCTMDRCFIAGLAYFLGVRAVGAAAIRNGHGTEEPGDLGLPVPVGVQRAARLGSDGSGGEREGLATCGSASALVPAQACRASRRARARRSWNVGKKTRLYRRAGTRAGHGSP